MIEPGELYYADLEDAGPHPVVIVSRESFNRGQYVMVVVCTSAGFSKRKSLPNCVPFQAGQFGLTADCIAQCENVITIDVSLLDSSRGCIGTLDEIARRDVIRAIGYVIEAECEPS